MFDVSLFGADPRDVILNLFFRQVVHLNVASCVFDAAHVVYDARKRDVAIAKTVKIACELCIQTCLPFVHMTCCRHVVRFH